MRFATALQRRQSSKPRQGASLGKSAAYGRDMRILLVGDVMLGRLVNQYLTSAKPEYPWGDTLAVV
jgi:poly-gamma-glutamate synthesis protein (capsule biosynthesis protein)